MSKVKTKLNIRLRWKLSPQKPPYKVRGIKKIERNRNYFDSDHELTLKKAPYKVGGQNDMNRKK